jgi:large subunit ribosomal protein L18
MKTMSNEKELKRLGRHERLRKRVQGTIERPRLCVHRSLKNLYAQVIDDTTGKVLMGFSTRNKEIIKKMKYGGNIAAATILGEVMAEKMKAQGVSKVCFDRGGYLYHGRVKAFAEGARKGGLVF